MKKALFLSLAFVFAFSLTVSADEGFGNFNGGDLNTLNLNYKKEMKAEIDVENDTDIKINASSSAVSGNNDETIGGHGFHHFFRPLHEGGYGSFGSGILSKNNSVNTGNSNAHTGVNVNANDAEIHLPACDCLGDEALPENHNSGDLNDLDLGYEDEVKFELDVENELDAKVNADSVGRSGGNDRDLRGPGSFGKAGSIGNSTTTGNSFGDTMVSVLSSVARFGFDSDWSFGS